MFYSDKRPDTVGEVGSSGEGGEARGTGGGPRHGPEPGGEAVEIDRGRGRHVLQAGPGQPAIAAAAEPEGAHPLREGALDPGPPGVAAPPFLGAEPCAARLERLVLGSRLQPQVPSLMLGPRAEVPRQAGGTSAAEHHRDVGVPA